MSRVIKLLGEPIQNEDNKAAEAITPGHLVDLNGSGDLIKWATAAALAPANFAMEREEMGQDIDTAYAIGDTVKVGSFHKGSRVNALIAVGQNIAKDQLLEAAADGTLRALAAGVALARAVRAVDNSGGSGAARISVEII